MSARDKARALVDEGIEDSFNDAVGALADMGEISQAQADRLMVSEAEEYVDADTEAVHEEAYAIHAAVSDAEEIAGEAAYFDRISRTAEIRGFCDPSPADNYDPEA